VGDLREVLNYIYDEMYAEYVAKNPLYAPGQEFRWVGWGLWDVWGMGRGRGVAGAAGALCSLLLFVFASFG